MDVINWQCSLPTCMACVSVCVEHIGQCFVGGEHALTGIKVPLAQPPLCRIGKPVL